MKKSLLTIAAFSLLFGACKKDDNGGGNTSNATATLTTGMWKITSSNAVVEYPAPLGNQPFDVYANLPACTKDDLYKYNTNNSITNDAGATKCNSSDPQQTTSGTWSLLNNDTQLKMEDPNNPVLTNVTADILTLNSTTLVLKYVTTLGGLNTTTTTTYAHVN